MSVLPPALTDLAAEIAERLVARGERVAVVESSAGGLISASLLSVPGASRYYTGGSVIYTLEGARATFARVQELPTGVRSSSRPFAEWLALSTRALFDTTWAIGETGAAGPSGNPYGDPAGHAWVAVARNGDAVAEHVLTGTEDRLENMGTFAAAALGLLLAQLEG